MRLRWFLMGLLTASAVISFNPVAADDGQDLWAALSAITDRVTGLEGRMAAVEARVTPPPPASPAAPASPATGQGKHIAQFQGVGPGTTEPVQLAAIGTYRFDFTTTPTPPAFQADLRDRSGGGIVSVLAGCNPCTSGTMTKDVFLSTGVAPWMYAVNVVAPVGVQWSLTITLFE